MIFKGITIEQNIDRSNTTKNLENFRNCSFRGSDDAVKTLEL